MSTKSPVKNSDNFFIGEDRVLEFTIVDASDVAVNISGWSLEWVLRRDPSSSAATLTKTTVSGITITNGAGGVCQVAIADTDTIDMEPGGYHHTLRRADAGFETVLAFGPFDLQQADTR